MNFPGLFTNMDTSDIPEGGGQVQDNCYARKAGQLMCRGGLRQIAFDNMSGGTLDNNDIIAVSTLSTPEAYFVVYQTTAGEIRVGKQPL